MFKLKKGHQPGVYVPLRALFLVEKADNMVRLHDGPDLKLFILVGWDRSFRLLLGPPGLN